MAKIHWEKSRRRAAEKRIQTDRQTDRQTSVNFFYLLKSEKFFLQLDPLGGGVMSLAPDELEHPIRRARLHRQSIKDRSRPTSV